MEREAGLGKNKTMRKAVCHCFLPAFWLLMTKSCISQPRDRTQVSRVAGGFFTVWATREAPYLRWPECAALLCDMTHVRRGSFFCFGVLEAAPETPSISFCLTLGASVHPLLSVSSTTSPRGPALPYPDRRGSDALPAMYSWYKGCNYQLTHLTSLLILGSSVVLDK